ncbi:BRCA1-associated RING domain protein 1-like isoform X2 [Prorops nasuta]|uniref:BRCA1-associated RING domain protein 1-like isoform X2 n=1 Tax=Prorops nasuta TaxID=863751 RepID=UPI0034CD1B44
MDKWKRTEAALDQFFSILSCEICHAKPVKDPKKFVICGHFVCEACNTNEQICKVCSTRTPNNYKLSDHILTNLIHDLHLMQEVITEKKCFDVPNKEEHNKVLPNKTISKKGESKFSKSSNDSTLDNYNYVPKIMTKNVHKRNAKGETPLHSACLKGQVEYVKILLMHGAKPNTKDNANWTPLQEAVSMGFYDITTLLLEAGACPDTPGMDNRTALHEAVLGNRENEVQLLLRYHANQNVFDRYGKKPIKYLLEGTNGDTSELLELNVSSDYRNCLDISIYSTTVQYIVFASNLSDDNRQLLRRIAKKHRIKIVSAFSSSVTHVVVETNDQNITKLTYDIILALLHGKWILNSQWISIIAEIDDTIDIDFELFEIIGSPVVGIPRKFRENAEKQCPRLFNSCYFYFSLQSKNEYVIGDIRFTKESLVKLVIEGEGTVLTREPDPNDIKCTSQITPFHVANNPFHSLYKCTTFIIYMPGKDEPRIKYNMKTMKSLPLIWLIECIEKFTLIDPTLLGITSNL